MNTQMTMDIYRIPNNLDTNSPSGITVYWMRVTFPGKFTAILNSKALHGLIIYTCMDYCALIESTEEEANIA